MASKKKLYHYNTRSIAKNNSTKEDGKVKRPKIILKPKHKIENDSIELHSPKQKNNITSKIINPEIEYDFDIDDFHLVNNIQEYLKKHQTNLNQFKNEECSYVYNIRKHFHPYLKQDGYLILIKNGEALTQLVWLNENHQLYRLFSATCIGNISKKEYDFSMGNVSSCY